MSIALLVITDGRDGYLAQAVASARESLVGPISERWMYDDTGDAAYRSHLADRYPEFEHINAGPRQGFGGAVRAAWTHLAERSRAGWVFHLEQDFVFRRPIDLSVMARVMDDHPYLLQMALCRQAWNTAERDAGGVVEANPTAFTDRQHDGAHWLEHRAFWTTNPSLYRRGLCGRGWPEDPSSEGRFTHSLLQYGALRVPADQVRFGYWGRRGRHVMVEHVGQQRVGVGY